MFKFLKKTKHLYIIIVSIFTMETIESNKNISLKLRSTTITLKAGTKKELDALALKKESYDDVIRKLIRENYELNQQLKEFSKHIIKSPNKLYFSSIKTKNSSYNIGNKKIFFRFNIPKKPLEYFRFNITYEAIIFNDIEIKNLYNYDKPLEMMRDYLRIYENLIQSYIDPLFKIDQRKILDLAWWEEKFKSLGFSNDTFTSDIKEKLLNFGVLP
jgi:hypothetical protein